MAMVTLLVESITGLIWLYSLPIKGVAWLWANRPRRVPTAIYIGGSVYATPPAYHYEPSAFPAQPAYGFTVDVAPPSEMPEPVAVEPNPAPLPLPRPGGLLLSEGTKADLLAYAESRGIVVRKSWPKAKLMEAIRLALAAA